MWSRRRLTRNRGWSGRQSHSVQFADLCVQGSVTGYSGGGRSHGSFRVMRGARVPRDNRCVRRRDAAPSRTRRQACASLLRPAPRSPRRRTPGSRDDEMWSPAATANTAAQHHPSLYSHSTYFSPSPAYNNSCTRGGVSPPLHPARPPARPPTPGRHYRNPCTSSVPPVYGRHLSLSRSHPLCTRRRRRWWTVPRSQSVFSHNNSTAAAAATRTLATMILAVMLAVTVVVVMCVEWSHRRPPPLSSFSLTRTCILRRDNTRHPAFTAAPGRAIISVEGMFDRNNNTNIF